MNIAEIVATETTEERAARWAEIDRLHEEDLFYWQGCETPADFAERERVAVLIEEDRRRQEATDAWFARVGY